MAKRLNKDAVTQDKSDAATNEQSRRLGLAIERHKAEIVRRWLATVQSHIAPGSGVEPTHLRDGIPAYLTSLVELLLTSDTEWSLVLESRWEAIAREHGVTRVRIGFDLRQLMHEFIVLRHVIADVVRADGIDSRSAAATLSDLLDGAIVASVRAYIGARDYEARRREAEHIGFLIHELRNPLSNATLAATQLRYRAIPAQTDLLDSLDRAHQRLNELIDGVLTTQKLESGTVVVKPVDTKLSTLVESALEAARSTAKEKRLDLRASYADVPVRVDVELTRSAIENLVDNATKYTDHGDVEVTTEESGGEFSIHVRDACGGLSDAELAIVFEPFKRGNRSKVGTGLGLSIARRAVEAQGGSIHAESLEEGCHFWITLPKHVVAPVTSGEDASR